MATSLLRNMIRTGIIITAISGGYIIGDSIGSDRGYHKGLDQGAKQAYSEAEKRGRRQGREEAIMAFVHETDDILKKLKADTSFSMQGLIGYLEYARTMEAGLKVLEDRGCFEGVSDSVSSAAFPWIML